MIDARTGLVIATPIIIGFALLLYRMGVLQRSGALAAVIASLIIGSVLFFSQ